MSTHRIQCSDRMCGADDCCNCHPENFKNGEFILIDEILEESEPPSLLPCPFCGASGNTLKHKPEVFHRFVMCTQCLACGPNETSESLATNPQWNKRHND